MPKQVKIVCKTETCSSYCKEISRISEDMVANAFFGFRRVGYETPCAEDVCKECGVLGFPEPVEAG